MPQGNERITETRIIPLEFIAARTIKGLAAQIIALDYTDPQAFEMAGAKLEEMADVLDRVKDHQSDMAYFGTPLLAIDGSGAMEIPVETPKEAEELDRIEAANPPVLHSDFAALISCLRPA